MTKPWCPMPFMHLAVHERGQYQLCCESQETRLSRVNPDFKPIKITENTPLEFFKSDYIERIREVFMFDEDPTEDEFVKTLCDKCITSEKTTGNSKRKRELNALENSLDELKANYFNDEYSLEFVKMSGIGNLCNLKCTMCGPASSNLIEEEIKQNPNNGYLQAPQERLLITYDDIENKEKWLDDLGVLLKGCKEIQFSGGEPTLIEHVQDICDWLLSREDLKETVIHMNTNGTAPYYKFEAMLEKGANIVINVSIDAMGKKDEYIRINTKWRTVERNMINYKKLKKQYPNSFNFYINPTIQVLNIGYVHEVVNHYLDLGIDVHPNGFVYYPEHLNAAILPIDLKKYYLEKINREIKPEYQFKLDKIFNILNTDSFSEKLMNQCFLSLDRFDLSNGTNWRALWPEIAAYDKR